MGWTDRETEVIHRTSKTRVGVTWKYRREAESFFFPPRVKLEESSLCPFTAQNSKRPEGVKEENYDKVCEAFTRVSI